jgi:hypothetical protein
LHDLIEFSCMQQGATDPEKVFDRTPNLENTQIINYRVDPLEKWCVLIGIAPGAPERYVALAGCKFTLAQSWAVKVLEEPGTAKHE